MIKIQNNTATREPLPDFLVGLAPESLIDLSWTDPALGVSDCGYWPESVEYTPINQRTQKYGDEILTIDAARKVVVVSYEVLEIPAEQVAANRAAAQSALWEQIKAKRDAIKHSGVKVSGKWFHTDDSSRIQQLGLVMMGASVPAVAWKTMDGSFVTMSQALAGAIFQAVAQLDMTAFQAAETHRAAMSALDDPSVYDFSTGWPEVFE